MEGTAQGKAQKRGQNGFPKLKRKGVKGTKKTSFFIKKKKDQKNNKKIARYQVSKSGNRSRSKRICKMRKRRACPTTVGENGVTEPGGGGKASRTELPGQKENA